MPGLLFVVTVPTKDYEQVLRNEPETDQPKLESSRDIDEDIKNLCGETSTKNTQEKLKKSETKVPSEQILCDVLKTLEISNACWNVSKDGKYTQALFNVLSRARCNNTLSLLKEVGLDGRRPHTDLSVLPCTLHHRNEKSLSPEDTKKSTWNSFLQSVRAEATVAHVLQQIKVDATITWDFLCLLLVAAIVAAMGLVENNTVFLVASMLISPLMGPITAGTFGTAIRDWSLVKTGIVNELIGVFCTLLVGFVFGLIGCSEYYGTGQWPTTEMMSRCDLRSLWVGALVAVPSGVAVAISVLSDNTSSLVGVAISASILPPAVNAGILWSMSLKHYMNEYKSINPNIKITSKYSTVPTIELTISSLVSLTLTLINIVAIYLAGTLIYWLKEVAPLNSPDIQFWKQDLKAVRDINKTILDESKINQSTAKPKSDNDEKKPNENISDEYRSLFGSKFVQADVLNQLVHYNGPYSTWPVKECNKKATIKELVGLYEKVNSKNPSPTSSQTSLPTDSIL